MDEEVHEATRGDEDKKEATTEDTGEHKETSVVNKQERVEETEIQRADSKESEEEMSGKGEDLDTGR